MTDKRSGKHNSPDSVIADYLDELLCIPADEQVYLDDHEHSEAQVRAEDSGPPEKSGPPEVSDPATAAPATSPHEAAAEKAASRLPPPLPVAERPTARLNLVSPTFRQAPPVEPAADAPAITPQPGEAVPAPPAVKPAPDVYVPPIVPPEPMVPVQGEVAAEVEAQPEADAWENDRPPWAQRGFECLIFRVAGLQLAVPLILLGAVHRLDRELTPLFGRPDWFMGLLKEGDQTINVADTALWVMPDRYKANSRSDYQFVIRLDDSHWGLACDEVAQSFKVQPEDVKWRTARSRRKWLAGTIRKQMCALLDVSELARMLADAEQGKNLDMRN